MLALGYEKDRFFKNAIDHAPNRGYTYSGGVLYQSETGKIRICIPDTPDCNKYIKETTLKHAHEGLIHGSFSKTYHFMSQHYYWPKMRQDTLEYCRSCPTCQRTKASTQKPYGLLKPLPILKQPGTHLSMDFLYLAKAQPMKNGPVHDHVWVTVDRFSKQTLPIELPEEATAEDLVRIFWTRIYPVFGIPEDIVSDRNTRFTSEIWKQFCKENNIHQSMSSAYHPEIDG